MDESELIPYEPGEVAGDRILVLSAHPDDETFGAGGVLARNAGTAEAIRVWVATDGTAQEGVDPADREAYGFERRRELIEAGRELGLAESSFVFAGMPDRGLASDRAGLAARLREQIETFRPDLILAPSPAEIHPDHRALAETLYEIIAATRPGDAGFEAVRFAVLVFYEVSSPLLPNVLVPLGEEAGRKARAAAAFRSQAAVRDYAGAMAGLNTYRRLTLGVPGPVEAFRRIDAAEVRRTSLAEFRQSIGPTLIRLGRSGPAPVAVVVRTRNRPALLREALESLRAQTLRPRRVVVVNDGGASPAEATEPFRGSFDLVLCDDGRHRGRSAAANLGVEAAGEELVAFLDDDDRLYSDHFERLVRAQSAGPEPAVYSDAVTVVYGRDGDVWKEKHRGLQYSADFDPDYLLFANYIPLHTLLLPAALYRKVGGFDPKMEYSEDWDFLIRLTDEAPLRHVRAVTCEYRVFEEPEAAHADAGSAPFQRAREQIYARYAKRRTEAALGRVFDRLRAQIAALSEREGVAAGELVYQRSSHRRLANRLAEVEGERSALAARLAEAEREEARLTGESEILEARLAEVFSKNEEYDRLLADAHHEVERLNGLLQTIYRSRTWKLHLFLDRLRGRR
jgi:LmbE family N-acetylglucosaminyl deacetylase/glycosyltransferase involved in cell wall biosynthesis